MKKYLTLSSLNRIRDWANKKLAEVTARIDTLEKNTGAAPTVGGSSIAKTKLEITMLAKDWSNQKYTLSNSNIKADSDIFMTLHAGSSPQVYKVFSEACIACAEQADGKLVLVANGTQPEQDVIVNFLIM